MNRFGGRSGSFTIIFFITTLALTSLACGSQQVEHFLCQRNKGEWVIPEGSLDGWCRYPYDRDIEASNAENATREAEYQGEETTAYTYAGQFTHTGMGAGGLIPWQEDGTVASNEVILKIASSGSVTGTFLYVVNGNILVSDDGGGSHEPCIDANDQAFRGQAAGQLSGDTGQITFEVERTMLHTLTAGCSIGPLEETSVDLFTQIFQITVSGNTLTGTNIPSEEYGNPIKAEFSLTMQ